MIFVTGCGGTVGRHVVAQLRKTAAPFRLGHHTTRKVDAAHAEGLQSVRIDFDQPETLEAAFDGATILFLLAPNTDRQVEQERAAVAAARRSGIETIVKLSAWRAGQADFSFARTHREIERAIEASGLAWTFLRPNGFMQNFSTFMRQAIVTQGVIRQPAADARISHIDARDIAAVAVKALTEPGHRGKAYDLSGRAALRFDEAAGLLSRATGRTITYAEQSEAEAHAELWAAGCSETYASAVLDLFRAYRRGAGEAVTTDVGAILGRDPISFEEFASDHVDCFR